MPFYERKSPRLVWYDYRQSGAYFITICTQDREHYFGKMVGEDMICNDLWKYIYTCRENIPNYHQNVELRDFVCMPNHIHGVLVINNDELIPNDNIYKSKFEYQEWSLWDIIRGFKIWVSKFAKMHNITFSRQGRYHDRIIRTDEEYQNISNYIANNPKNWKEDWFWW